jgi:hypothetical protein
MPNSLFTGFSMQDLEDMVDENPSLRGYIQGYLAERRLKTQIETLPYVTSVEKIKDQSDEKGDFRVIYKGMTLTVESKSVATDSVKEDLLTQTWQAKVRVKNSDRREVIIEGFGTINTSCLTRGQFDILAISCFAVSGEWDFLFIENRYLPGTDMPGLMKTSFLINPSTTPCLTSNLPKLLETCYLNKVQLAQAVSY